MGAKGYVSRRARKEKQLEEFNTPHNTKPPMHRGEHWEHPNMDNNATQQKVGKWFIGVFLLLCALIGLLVYLYANNTP